MRNFSDPPPLSIYVHLPWCVQKCPYCDFNSHEIKGDLPEDRYINALLDNLSFYQNMIQNRKITSIFFGGGTPSLFKGSSIKKIIDAITSLNQNPIQEITLEANPGTVDYEKFSDFKDAGVNRLSLGFQSLQNEKLKVLGRIHNSENAIKAFEIAKKVGFTNINIDMMFGLPSQTVDDALSDLKAALSLHPTHFSWYQLTLEPNTFFHHHPPQLPSDDLRWDMQELGQQYLATQGFKQYEVSAYAQNNKQCLHNLNYWQFGDYLGIGAGAHSKITDVVNNTVTRFAQVKHPKDFFYSEKRAKIKFNLVSDQELIFEFMLNTLRLTNGFTIELFNAHTGLEQKTMQENLLLAEKKGLLVFEDREIKPTELGKRFLNDLVMLFL